MRRWALLLPTLALAASGLSACDDDAPEQAGPPRPEDAEQGEEVDVDAFLDELEQSFDDGATARVTFSISGAGAGQGRTRLRGRGVVAYDDDGMDVDLHLSDWQVPGGTVDLRTIGGATYLRVPESRGLWVVLGGDDLGLTASVLMDADPRAQIDDAREEITEVRYGGEDSLGRTTTRRYQVVSSADSADSAGTGRSDAAGSAPTDGGPVVTDYWFDADGRVVRRSVDLGSSGSASFTWADWGRAVEIAPPSPEETITVRELERLRRQQEGRAHR